MSEQVKPKDKLIAVTVDDITVKIDPEIIKKVSSSNSSKIFRVVDQRLSMLLLSYLSCYSVTKWHALKLH